MALNSNVFCSLDELKSFMGITDTSKDSILTIYINGISKQISNLIGRNIFAADYTEKYEGTNAVELILKHYPVNSIASIKYVLDNVEYLTLDDSEYYFNIETGIAYKDNGWIKQGYSSLMSGRINFPRQHIKISYNAGYSTAPDDLKLVCLQAITDNYSFDNSQGGVLKSYGISDIKMDFKDDIKFSDNQMKTIMSYRGVRV